MPRLRSTPTSESLVRRGGFVALALLPLLFTACDRPTDSGGQSTAAAPAAAQSVDAEPPLRFDPPMLGFGNLAPNSTRTKTVRIINEGAEPVKILAIQPGCKCTTVNDLDGTVIAPGESVALDAELAAQPSPGRKRAEIKVLAEGYSRVKTLMLEGTISHKVRATPPYINTVGDDPRQNYTGQFLLEAIDRVPFRVLSVHGAEPVVRNFDPATDEPRANYQVQYDVEDWRKPDGRLPRYVVVETDHPEAPVLSLLLRTRDNLPRLNMKLTDYKANLGAIPAGGSREFTVGINEYSELLTTGVSSNPEIELRLLDQTPDTEGVLQVRFLVMVRPEATPGVRIFEIVLYNSTRDQEIAAFLRVVPADAGEGASAADGAAAG